jgi:hypothetical protein
MDDGSSQIEERRALPASIPRDGGKGHHANQRNDEKMNIATTEAAHLVKNSYLTMVEDVPAYNNQFIEFAQANTNAACDFVQKLSGAEPPSEFIELSTEHARQQIEMLTEQTKQLVTLAQKVTLATAEPLKTGVADASKHAA